MQGLVTTYTVLALVVATACKKPARKSEPPPPLPAVTALPPGQATLPDWFGLPAQPSRRIAGQLFDEAGPVAGTVHLRIDVPDATIWKGFDQTTGPDGRFDFGPLRRGHYALIATAPDRVSRAVPVDTTTSEAALSVYAYPCKVVSSVVKTVDGKPVAGAQIDLSGLVLEPSDGTGTFRACLANDAETITIRAPGYAARDVFFDRGWLGSSTDVEEATTLRGRVFFAPGVAAANVAVQPFNVPQVPEEHGQPYYPWPVQATTDANGWFVIRNVPRLDRATADTGVAAKPARYYFRVIKGSLDVVDRSDDVLADSAAIAEVQLADAPATPRDDLSFAHNVLIAGRILHDGKPLPDAAVALPVGNSPFETVRTDAEGRFVLHAWGDSANLAIDHATGLSATPTVAIAPGSSEVHVDIELIGNGKLEGTVLDADRKPLAGADVWLTSHGSWAPLRAVSGPEGRFSIDNVALGNTYKMDARYGSVSKTSEVTLDAAHRDVTGLQIELPAHL